MRCVLKQLFTILTLCLMLFPQAGIAVETYQLARAPQLSAAVTLENWTPFVEYLSEKTGKKITLKVYSSRESFEKEIAKGKIAFLFGNPGYAVVSKTLHGYQPLVRSDRKMLKGIVVTRKDSPYNVIEDLNGKVIAFPDETAFAASLYIRYHLKRIPGFKFSTLYMKTHDNVYRNVLVDKTLAGGGVRRTLEREPEKLKKQLRIIYETPGVAPHPLMVHPDVPPYLRQAIISAVLELDSSAEGREMLKRLKLQKPVRADYQRDYLPIEPLAIEMYSYLEE